MLRVFEIPLMFPRTKSQGTGEKEFLRTPQRSKITEEKSEFV